MDHNVSADIIQSIWLLLSTESEYENSTYKTGFYKPLSTCNGTKINKLHTQASIIPTNTKTQTEKIQHHRNAIKKLTNTLVLLSVLFLFPTPLHICKHEINLQ
jgi:hypothetical protein